LLESLLPLLLLVYRQRSENLAHNSIDSPGDKTPYESVPPRSSGDAASNTSHEIAKAWEALG
jgi:hypothetical protein